MLKLDHLTIIAPTLAEGVAHVLACILAEADLMMAVNGMPTITDVRREGARRLT